MYGSYTLTYQSKLYATHKFGNIRIHPRSIASIIPILWQMFVCLFFQTRWPAESTLWQPWTIPFLWIKSCTTSTFLPLLLVKIMSIIIIIIIYNYSYVVPWLLIITEHKSRRPEGEMIISLILHKWAWHN